MNQGLSGPLFNGNAKLRNEIATVSAATSRQQRILQRCRCTRHAWRLGRALYGGVAGRAERVTSVYVVFVDAIAPLRRGSVGDAENDCSARQIHLSFICRELGHGLRRPEPTQTAVRLVPHARRKCGQSPDRRPTFRSGLRRHRTAPWARYTIPSCLHRLASTPSRSLALSPG